MNFPLNQLTRLLCASLPANVLFCGFFFGTATSPLNAQAPLRFPVTPKQVLLAMQGRDWSLDEVRIRLSAPVTSTVQEPALEITSVSQGPGHDVMLRMTCHVHTECLPFYASAMWPADGRGPGAATKGGLGAMVHTNQATGIFLSSPEVRAGSPATLLLEGGPVHIRLHVVLAQNARVGETVRVTTPDRKQVYVAEMLSTELLKGELQK